MVDEAYIDFSSKPSAASLTAKYPNLIVMQTLSKAWGLAGLRIGLAIANAQIVSIFKKVKYPYNIGTDTLSLALEQLRRDIAPQVATIVAERDRLAAALPNYKCVLKVYPSDANFLLVKVTNPRGLYSALLGQGVIVRDRSTVKGCEGCLRLTVGTPEENAKMEKTIAEYES